MHRHTHTRINDTFVVYVIYLYTHVCVRRTRSPGQPRSADQRLRDAYVYILCTYTPTKLLLGRVARGNDTAGEQRPVCLFFFPERSKSARARRDSRVRSLHSHDWPPLAVSFRALRRLASPHCLYNAPPPYIHIYICVCIKVIYTIYCWHHLPAPLVSRSLLIPIG